MGKRVLQKAILAIFVLTFSPGVASGATFYVRLDGSNSNTGSANNSGGAWRTIDYAADRVSAGDIVRVQAGTYVEVVTPGVSGTSGNTVTLVADGVVTTCGMSFSSRNYIRVIGFTMDGAAPGCSNTTLVTVNGSNTGLEFWNNTFDNSNHGFLVGASDRCNSCIIVGGSFSRVNNNSQALTITGNDAFVGYTAFDQIAYLGVVPSGHRSRFVNLNFSNFRNPAGSHPDFFFPQGLNTFGWSNNLIESIYGIGTPTITHNKAMHISNQTGGRTSRIGGVPWNDNIWRSSVTYNLGSGFFSVYDFSGPINRLHFYNNTHVNCVRANNTPQHTNCGNLSAVVGNGVSATIHNSIFYQAWADVASDVAVWAESGSPSVTKDNNLAYSPNGSLKFWGNWNQQAYAKSNVNPRFVNASSDFTLQSSSGARGTGGALTAASGSGRSSTSLRVAANTGSMFIGDNAVNLPQYGGALVPGDEITVGFTTVQVSGVSGDTLTLASPISWNDGDPVYFGSSRTVDIGAYPYKSGGYALRATYAIAARTATITPNDPSLVRFVVCYDDGVPYAVDNSSPYTCAAPAGKFSANVYPRYASPTLWLTVGGGVTAPTKLRIEGN
jgi:hypothetical protein